MPDVETTLHPFAFAAKVQSDDFPTYHEILYACLKTNANADALDVEMSDQTERQAYELVPRSHVIQAGKKYAEVIYKSHSMIDFSELQGVAEMTPTEHLSKRKFSRALARDVRSRLLINLPKVLLLVYCILNYYGILLVSSYCPDCLFSLPLFCLTLVVVVVVVASLVFF